MNQATENETRKDVEQYFASGQYEKAEALLQILITDHASDPEILSDLAAVLFAQNKINESLKYIHEALRLDPACAPARENLEIICRTRGWDPAEIFSAIEKKPEDKKTSSAGCEQAGTARRSIRVLFLEQAGLGNFLKGVADRISDDEDIEGRYISVTPNTPDLPIQWADVIWMDWAARLSADLTSQLPLLQRKKVIVRLHRFEAFTQYPRLINWAAVDRLVFVSDYMRRTFRRLHPNVNVASEVIHNGVDIEKFTPPEFPPEKPDIAFAAHLNMRKNIPLLLQIAQRLDQFEAPGSIRVAGDWQSAELKEYAEHMLRETGLHEKVIFEDWAPNMPDWLGRMRFILSTSIHESFGLSIAEGMACGLKPVIHNFPGASEIFPPEYIFNTVDEAADMIRSGSESPSLYRNYIEDNYPLARQAESTARLIKELFENGDAAKVNPGAKDRLIMPKAEEVAPRKASKTADAVITWVDGDDPRHRAKRLKYMKMEPGADISGMRPTRFKSSFELWHCVKLIRRNAQWIDRIFLVTDSQRPDWLSNEVADREKITIVDHSVIFSGYERALPTFSSRAIETMLYRIPGLADDFVYLNDDFFIVAPTRKEDYFTDGMSRWRGKYLIESATRDGYAGLRAEKCYFDQDQLFVLAHAPEPINRNLMQFILEKNGIVEKNTSYRFRNANQIAPVSLVANAGLKLNISRVGDHDDWEYIDPALHSPEEMDRRLARCERNRSVKSLCVQSIDIMDKKMRDRVENFLKSKAGE